MTVHKENNGTWSVRCWYKDYKGERRQKTKRGFLKQKDAKTWERIFLEQEQSAVVSMDALINAFEEYTNTLQKMGKIKETTANRKRQYLRAYIRPFFKQMDIKSVSTLVVNKWIAELSNTHARLARRSSSTTRIIRNMLSQIFDFGIKHFNIKSNPVKNSDAPEQYTNDKRVKNWTVEQYDTFYNSLTKDWHKLFFNMLYWGGFRIGELLALTPADVNNNVVTVNKTWVRISSKQEYATTPKTPSSNRKVILPRFVARQLQIFIDGIEPDARIFPTTQQAAAKLLNLHSQKLGLPRLSLHTLRHSYASNLLSATKDYVTTAAQLGHKNPQTTFRVYAHRLDEPAQQSIDELEKMHK